MTTAHFHHLYDDGRHYDQLFAPEATGAVLDFYCEHSRRADGPILELACGTGRILIPLARQGHQVVGIDLSEAMLAEARRKVEAQKLDAEWVQGDIRDFDLDTKFGLIYLPNNTLCHLLDHEAFAACMTCVKRHLLPAGRFIVDVFIPSPELLVDKAGERFPFGDYTDPDGHRIDVTHSYTYEHHTQIKRITTYHQIDDAEAVAGTLDMRMYYPQELDLLFEHNGFAIDAKFGGYDRSPFDAEAKTQVVICRLK